jgi:hypothetical protein
MPPYLEQTLDGPFVRTRVAVSTTKPSGSVGCDVTIVDPTCPSYLGKSESVLFRDAEQAKTRKHVLNGATMVPLVMSMLGKLGPAAEGYLQNIAHFSPIPELCTCSWSWHCFTSLLP